MAVTVGCALGAVGEADAAYREAGALLARHGLRARSDDGSTAELLRALRAMRWDVRVTGTSALAWKPAGPGRAPTHTLSWLGTTAAVALTLALADAVQCELERRVVAPGPPTPDGGGGPARGAAPAGAREATEAAASALTGPRARPGLRAVPEPEQGRPSGSPAPTPPPVAEPPRAAEAGPLGVLARRRSRESGPRPAPSPDAPAVRAVPARGAPAPAAGSVGETLPVWPSRRGPEVPPVVNDDWFTFPTPSAGGGPGPDGRADAARARLLARLGQVRLTRERAVLLAALLDGMIDDDRESTAWGSRPATLSSRPKSGHGAG
jgi:hypothetical protein